MDWGHFILDLRLSYPRNYFNRLTRTLSPLMGQASLSKNCNFNSQMKTTPVRAYSEGKKKKMNFGVFI